MKQDSQWSTDTKGQMYSNINVKYNYGAKNSNLK